MAAPTISLEMGDVVDLKAWQQARERDDPVAPDPDIRRLELAVARLDAAASAKLSRGRRLEASVETELLAILGAITADLVDDAADRAERLVEQL